MCLFRRVFKLESGLIKTVSGAQIVRNIWRSWIEETSWSLRNLCLATLNTHALKETQYPSLTYFRGQRSGSGVACFRADIPCAAPALLRDPQDRFFTLIQTVFETQNLCYLFYMFPPRTTNKVLAHNW